jgi:hypothetical protein
MHVPRSRKPASWVFFGVPKNQTDTPQLRNGCALHSNGLPDLATGQMLRKHCLPISDLGIVYVWL